MNWVAEAIARLGGPSETVGRVWSRGVRTSTTNLHRCQKSGRIVDTDLCLALSELTGISPWLLAGRDVPSGSDPEIDARGGAAGGARVRALRSAPQDATGPVARQRGKGGKLLSIVAFLVSFGTAGRPATPVVHPLDVPLPEPAPDLTRRDDADAEAA